MPGGRYRPVPGDLFGGVSSTKSEYWFHRNTLDEFKRWMADSGYGPHNLDIRYHEAPAGEQLKVAIHDWLQPRDYQIPIVDFICEENENIRVVTLQTGKGKTKTSLIAAARFGKKVLIMVPAMYTDMWYKEVETCFTHKKGDIILVKGLKALKAMLLLREAKEADPSVYIISSQTIALLLKEYETNPKLAVELCCRPEKLMELLGVGYRIIDEVHKNTLLNYKVDCYTNLNKAVYLSATLDTVDRFVGRMRSIAYPVRDRYTGLEYDKYIRVIGLAYNAENANKIRCRGAKGYSHIEFEKSIMKLQGRQKKYFNLITEIVKRKYVDVREPGQRCLVFAASVDFCAAYTKHLKALYPNLKIGKYTQEDNYQDMLTNDITVSTVLSAGTGVDVAGLRTVVMTNSMDSWSANEQVKGRLRRLADWPEISPEFYYIFCSDIPKHVEYHQRKMDYFKDKCLSHHVYNSGFCI